jgi:hypothetical protein
MSSAKTIADILSFSELVDGKSFIGNPFTSQPMYIAACAFLMESAYYSSPSSRSGSPSSQPLLANQTSGFVMPNMDSSNPSERKPTTKHSLLASAARENYQRCYKALKALETYWEGTKYILTVLDQKAKGIMDPLLYTEEEMEGTSETPTVQPIAGTNWRQAHVTAVPTNAAEGPAPGAPDPGQGEIIFRPASNLYHSNVFSAIGWALTNATNSSQPNLSLLYQMPAAQAEPASENKTSYSSQFNHGYTNLPSQPGVGPSPSPFPRDLEPTNTSTAAHESHVSSGRVTTSDANLLLGLNTHYPGPTSRPPNSQSAHNQNIPSSSSSNLDPQVAPYSYIPVTTSDRHGSNLLTSNFHSGVNPHMGDLLIESQDIDMSALQQQDQFPFPINGLPWLEYLPQDVLSYFGSDHQNYPLMSPDEGPQPPH